MDGRWLLDSSGAAFSSTVAGRVSGSGAGCGLGADRGSVTAGGSPAPPSSPTPRSSSPSLETSAPITKLHIVDSSVVNITHFISKHMHLIQLLNPVQFGWFLEPFSDLHFKCKFRFKFRYRRGTINRLKTGTFSA